LQSTEKELCLWVKIAVLHNGLPPFSHFERDNSTI